MSNTDDEWQHQIKVTYWQRDGSKSTAYIDERTGAGTDKHSDIPVILEWRDDGPYAPHWHQVDTWEWEWNHDRFVRVDDAG